ncbi:DoxX family protein [Halobacillus salinus]|uniref:DoxX family protein n=1 Tax=Halobacillus salinus TaxID=192814 RepID=UPI0015906107|nr:DoxX family protein [Halobacillus salinus]
MRQEISLLIVRVILGIIFFFHGLSKYMGGISNTAAWFESIGLSGMLAYVVGSLEMVGGALLIIGLGTKILSALFAIVMIGAIFTVKLPAGLLGNGQGAGYELDLALLAMSVALLVSGNRLFSLDHVLFGEE